MTRRHNPLRAQLALLAVRSRRIESRERMDGHGWLALLLLLIVMLGAPVVDLWFPADPVHQVATPEDPLPWLPAAPDLWISERVDLPPNLDPHTWANSPPEPARADVWRHFPTDNTD